MKSKQILIIVGVLVIVVVAAILLFTTGAYTGYASAYDNTFKTGSFEFNTKITAECDGNSTESTGNLKVKDTSGDSTFINEMTLNGVKITQFKSGNYFCQDNGIERTKFVIDASKKPEMQEDQKQGNFSIDGYLQEFASLLDASKIKELNIAEKINQNMIEKITKSSSNGSTVYDVTLATQLVNDLAASLVNSAGASSGSPNPSVNVGGFKYTTTVNGSNYIENINYTINLAVTFPAELTGGAEETKNIDLQLALTTVNPGQPVDFTVPDANDYQEVG